MSEPAVRARHARPPADFRRGLRVEAASLLLLRVAMLRRCVRRISRRRRVGSVALCFKAPCFPLLPATRPPSLNLPLGSLRHGRGLARAARSADPTARFPLRASRLPLAEGPPDGTNNCRLGDRDHSSSGRAGRRPTNERLPRARPRRPRRQTRRRDDLAPGCRINAGTVADQADQPSLQLTVAVAATSRHD
jgi:hypothetical protein